jgi:hypothetical protein
MMQLLVVVSDGLNQYSNPDFVMPAKAGIQNRPDGRCFFKTWIPAFAGMTT